MPRAADDVTNDLGEWRKSWWLSHDIAYAEEARLRGITAELQSLIGVADLACPLPVEDLEAEVLHVDAGAVGCPSLAVDGVSPLLVADKRLEGKPVHM